jgi:hypothetical protein
MTTKHLCDGCGADMGSCRFPAVIEIGPNAGTGLNALRVELRPVDGLHGNRELDVCRECIVAGLMRDDAAKAAVAWREQANAGKGAL